MTDRAATATDAEVEAAFAEAWIKCMTEHDATLVSGPCLRCAAEAGERLRLSASPVSASSGVGVAAEEPKP